MPSQGVTVGIAIVTAGAFAVLCLVYYFAWYRPHEEKRRQREERRGSNLSEEHRNGEVVVELEAVVVHRHRDRDRDHDDALEGPQQRKEARSQSRGQQTSPTRGNDENRPHAPEYNPLGMHASMHSMQHALPGPPVLPPVYYIPQPPASFFGPVIPPPPPPPPPGEPASDPPKTPRRRHRGRRRKRHSRNSKVHHPSPGRATTISDDGSDRGGSLLSVDRRGHSTSRGPVRSRSASPGQSPEVSPTQNSIRGKTSIASSSLGPESISRLNDLVQHGGDPVSPAERNQDNASATTLRSDIAEDSDRGATHHRQSALETLESATELPLLSEEDEFFNDPAARQRQAQVGRANRRYEINQDRSTNALMFMRPADDEPRIYESRIGRRQQRENQTTSRTDSGSGSTNEDENVDLVSPINITRFPADVLGLGVGESRVGQPGSQYPTSSRESRFDGPRPRQPFPESCVGGRQRSPSRESFERPTARREPRGFPGMTGESRIGQQSSSSGQSYQEGDNELREGGGGPVYRRPSRIQDSPTFGNLVPLQHPGSSSRTSSNGHRRSSSILNNGFFNNNLPEPNNQGQGRSAISQVSSTGAVCSYDSDSDSTQPRRRATSLGGGSIFEVNSNTADTDGYGYGDTNSYGGGSRGGNRSVSGPGGFPSGGGARD